ncbi:MAG: hypothetical protein CSA53_03690 [Gammaproteobacteria bacterium]|nr:MAG: hypothetical protein CSA53_03690 [Gammaproteobacteria bacterium]
MEATLIRFIDMLRSHDVRVSPAETLDAIAVASLMGFADRAQLRLGLSQTLAKSELEKQRFYECFDQFFSAVPNSTQGDTQAESTSESSATNAADDTPPSRASKQAELAEAIAQTPELDDFAESQLWQQLRDGGDTLAIAIAQAAGDVGLSSMRLFTQRGQFSRRMLDAMGEQHLQSAIDALADRPSAAHTLKGMQTLLRERVKEHVEQAYALRAPGHHRQFMERKLAETHLNAIEREYEHKVYELVRKMARKLAARYARKRRIDKRGQLDMAKTLRRGIPNDGLMFQTHWKKTRKNQPHLLALCDVSGSVATYAKFLLMFLYSLQDVLPKVRSFAFSSELGEVSDYFEQQPIERAIEQVNVRYGGATDYGTALADFAELALADINQHTTVIILGDARNNQGEARLDILRSVYQRAAKVIWLNPEPQAIWGTGDSEMLRYQSACHFTAQCSSLRQLERIVDQLLRQSR